MIISDSRKQVFCHIPKNGGSSLRAHFLAAWNDAREYQGRREVPALEGKKRDLTHITIEEAKNWFDDDLIGKGLKVTAVIRAPMPRFSSALLQYIRSFAAKDKHFVTADSVKQIMAETSVEAICRQSNTDFRYIYFRCQSDFVFGIPGEKRDLVPFEQLSMRFPQLPKDNQGGSLPSWMSFAKHPAVKRIAGGLGREVKTRLNRRLIQKDSEVEVAISNITNENKAFLKRFYAEDQALYDRVRATL